MSGSSTGPARSDSALIRTERLSALGQMASGIAHDFNNQLSMVLGYSELLLMNEKTLDDRALTTEYLGLIKTAAQDAAEIVRRLRSFYRFRDSGEEFSAVALSEVAIQAVSLTRPKWGEQSQAGGLTIDVQTELADQSVVMGNEVELREVLTNLIFNAVDAMESNGTITVSTAAVHGTVLHHQR
jgi:signal transduction histidine kinase